MEVLSKMLSTACQSGLIAGFLVAWSYLLRLEIFHLFVDDMIIFCDDECERLINLCCTLVWFEVVSGLRVNISKSSIL